MSDFPGTECYRERVASIQSWLESKRCFGLEVALRTLVEEQNEEVEALCDHIEEQEKEVEILREALKFYADETNWTPWWWKGLERTPEAVEDDGDKAREALKVESE